MGWLAAGLAASAIMLGGCAADLRPAGPPVETPSLTAEAWRAADGAVLPLRHWAPAGDPLAILIALHGMNDYSNAFDAAARAFAARGIATYAYDQRGFGGGPHPGIWSDSATMQADLRAIIALLAARHPGRPLFVLGESMGGAVAATALAGPPPPALAGLILSAPAVWGRADMAWLQRGLLWLCRGVVPGLTLTGRGLDIRPSDNIEMLRALSADPLVIKATRIDAIAGLVDLMDEAPAAMARLDLPVLVLYGAKDEIIPPEPTWAAIAGLPEARRRVAYYPDGWHMLLRDLQAARVIDDVAAWIIDRAGPLPSGADRRGGEDLARRQSETR
jgi:alpha-beta hydrolase superfamily lysophospholipase